MEVFLIAFSTIAIAEIGDRTQLLSLFLSAHFRKPWPITAGIFVATLANHALAGLLGVWLGRYLTPPVLDGAVGVSMLAMAGWTLIPDKLSGDTNILSRGAFLTTLAAFFIAEIGDKTQIATLALAAGYSNLPAIVAGTTLGMMAANIPVVFLGVTFAKRLPMKQIHYVASVLFALLGLYFIARAVAHWPGMG
ncbi:MAG TPA: TMEM165/GDT1 family protein [Rhizomicrobium sp.]|jgi:putative Ca2+/H+ antiporter (TMEM165/GDT1 family)